MDPYGPLRTEEEPSGDAIELSRIHYHVLQSTYYSFPNGQRGKRHTKKNVKSENLGLSLRELGNVGFIQF